MLGDSWAALADLVLPADCAGCRSPGGRLRYGVCESCVATVRRLRPHPVRPVPAPAGLPPCVALGPYDGVLRELLLAYKEKGRHQLARPLGRLLGEAVAAATDPRAPLTLVPVPTTAAAARARHGDHLARLTRHAVRRLRFLGREVGVARPVGVRSRPDSAGLDSASRLAAARTSYHSRRVGLDFGGIHDPRRCVIVVDDIVTTGATLATVNRLLTAAGTPAYAAVMIAATRLRHQK
ncbi:ComF family protein [Solwaraspora sp. WMMD406]|uniref:ComF family protein n=1 Tax=Solwaraspora sp. WMMD406 TaxID=3016095 RepID=UPI00241754D8|nr:ComF family protein [Solwaraspora sp. WMMD406]MDG4763939.1 ComF family protein [Solwaraspora sp. WMMD406]